MCGPIPPAPPVMHRRGRRRLRRTRSSLFSGRAMTESGASRATAFRPPTRRATEETGDRSDAGRHSPSIKPATANCWRPTMRPTIKLFLASLLFIIPCKLATAATDDGVAVDRGKYADRALATDFTAGSCPNMPHSLEQVRGNLYRPTAGAGLAVHSGLVLVTNEGALVIDPA